MIQFILLFSRQGKLRLQKWYTSQTDKSKKKITREIIAAVLSRKPKMSSFLEWKELKIVYKRYASLYFCCAIEQDDNELLTLETIHRYVELLDKYFGSVCELDIIFNFEKAYFIFDEFILGGEVQETSKKSVLKAVNDQDVIQENIVMSHKSRLSSPGEPQTPPYSLRMRKRRTEQHNDYSTEEIIHVKIDADTAICVTDLLELLTALIEYKDVKSRQVDSEEIQNQIEKSDKIVEQCLIKLPSLKSVQQNELIISNSETNLKVLQKQFYYVILYYMINKHWPCIKQQAPSLVSLRAFFTLIQYLIDHQILTKFDENVQEDNVFISYVITGVAYLIVANDPRCSRQSVRDFTRVISHGFELVNTSGQAFIQFFTLLQRILSTQFVVQLYCELINYEEYVSQETIENALAEIMSKLKSRLYMASLPDYYCALTLFDGKLLINKSEGGLFEEIQNMLKWTWDCNAHDEIMIQEWASLLIVIVHEIAHSLRRTIIPNARNLMLAQTPPKSSAEKTREAGFCVEQLLFGDKVDSIGLYDGEFLLKTTSWDALDVEIFQTQFKEARIHDMAEHQHSRLILPSRCSQVPACGGRSRIGDCATSRYGIRLNNQN